MKRYVEYKDSGVEWLGEVPKSWNIQPLKFITDFVNGAPFKPAEWSEKGVPIIRIENLNGSMNFNYYQGTIDQRYHVQKGDLLFGWSGNRGTSFGPFLWNIAGQFYLNQHIFKMVGFKCDKNWFYWTLKAVTFHVENQAHGIIGMVHITKGDLGGIKIPIIENFQQKFIATFLDQKTSQIDSLISKKKQMIDLLKEERAAIINHAVTKGINPDAEMKDSGVEWLGEVPKHWEVKRLKFICEGKLMYGANESADSDDPNQPRYIRITDFGDDGKLRNETFKSLPAEIAEPYLLKEGDILFARSGATVGKTFQFKNYGGKACFAGYLIKAAPNETIVTTDFFYLFTKSSIYDNWKNSIFIQATIQNIGADKYNNFILCLPPIKEQNLITSYLNQKTTQIDSSITHIEKEITLIEEYRTALINETVTGKIDIRDKVNV